MSQPLVTIVTPSLNQGRFIRATIESVLEQDYPHIEYMIMDGGSTDETASIVREYASRLTWISEKDRGQSHAINKGFQMARGEIVSWLNSDDTILPGAVRHAVAAFARNPRAGAVYGEGYTIDESGAIKERFPVTVPFNLWKLVYVCDYVLQQTVYFRRAALEQIGLLDESLHWGMDWEILMRLGKRFGLEYTSEYMGCIREYEETKTSSGGERRFRELAAILRRHGDRRYPPAYFIYGLDTYLKVWRQVITRWSPALLAPKLEALVSMACGIWISRHYTRSQGWYADGWAGPKLHWMVPQGSRALRVRGALPEIPALAGQQITLHCNGARLGLMKIPFGDFDFTLRLPPELATSTQALMLRAARSYSKGKDSPRVSYLMRSVDAMLEDECTHHS